MFTKPSKSPLFTSYPIFPMQALEIKAIYGFNILLINMASIAFTTTQKEVIISAKPVIVH